MGFCSIQAQLEIECGDEYPQSGTDQNIYLLPTNAIDEAAVTADAASHAFSAFGVLDSELWSVIQAKIDTSGLEAENTKDGGGDVYNPVVSLTVPNIDKLRSFVIQKFGKQRMTAIVPLNTRDSVTGNRKAVMIGYDAIVGKSAGANFTFNTQVQPEKGQMNGYVCEISASQGESVRFCDFSICKY